MRGKFTCPFQPKCVLSWVPRPGIDVAAMPSISTVDSFSGIKMREKRLLPDRFWAEALSIKPAVRTNGKRREAENSPAGSTRIHPGKSLFTAFPSPLAGRNVLIIRQFPILMPNPSCAQEIIEDRPPDPKSLIFLVIF